MKKLLVLFLVLGVASLANAGLVIDASGYTDDVGATPGSGNFNVSLTPYTPIAGHLQGIACTLSILPAGAAPQFGSAGSGTVGAATSFGQFTMYGGGAPVMEQAMMAQTASTASSTSWSGAGLTGFGYMSATMDVVSGIAATNTGKTTFVLTTGLNATALNDGTWQPAGNSFENGAPVDFGGTVGVINNVLDYYTTPEPMTMTLLGLGGLGLLRRRR